MKPSTQKSRQKLGLRTIGGRIMALRSDRRESRKEAGESLEGVSPTTIARYETNPNAAPKPDILERIYRLWHGNLNWVVTGDGPRYLVEGQSGLVELAWPGKVARISHLPKWMFGECAAGLHAYKVDIANTSEGITQGDYAIVCMDKPRGLSQEATGSGALFVVERDGKRSVRRIIRQAGGKLHYTDELGISPWVTPTKAWPKHLKILGQVIGVIRQTVEVPVDRNTD